MNIMDYSIIISTKHILNSAYEYNTGDGDNTRTINKEWKEMTIKNEWEKTIYIFPLHNN